MQSRSPGTDSVSSHRPALLAAFFLASGMLSIALPASAQSLCGNGIVEADEQCDAGSALGSPDCNTLCRAIEFEPPGLPFELGAAAVTETSTVATIERRIYSPRLSCAPYDARKNARHDEPAHVRYRIHLCQTEQGEDAFTPEQVRNAMADAEAEYALGGIVLEEESLVRFSHPDCDMPLGDRSWEDELRENTPQGILAVAFVAGITSTNTQFSIGGFCYFEGPLCVNAGAYPSLVIHELGHFFGLAHTHECAYGLETPETCDETGDFICDTPPDRGPAGRNGIASCDEGGYLNGSCSGSCGAKICLDGSTPDSYDWMSYYHCQPGHFTDEQQDYMRCMLDNEMSSFNSSFVASTTTSTTLPTTMCGDVTGEGELTASDALGVLRAGVGLTECPAWVCDYNGSGVLSASDALAVLQAAVGFAGTADCPHDPGSDD